MVTSWEIGMKLPEPLCLRLRGFSRVMREAKAMKLGPQRAGVEETHEE